MTAISAPFAYDYLRMCQEKPGIALLSAVQVAYDSLPASADLTERKRLVFERVAAGELLAAAQAALPGGVTVADDDAERPERPLVLALLSYASRIGSETEAQRCQPLHSVSRNQRDAA